MKNKPPHIFLSPPHLGGAEMNYIQEAFAENFISTVGANLQKFETEICKITGAKYTVALNSGTAAIHLALQVLGVAAGDEVLCASFTFVATANPILYQGAVPVFIDSEPETWNICPDALDNAILDRLKKGKKPKAIIVVHLYGRPAKISQILNIAKQYEIPVIEDAAEALGSTYEGKALGTFGEIGIFSFNGNKIITTSGGGALITNNRDYAQKALFLATQARDPAPYYHHSEMGFNYRLSNILAGIGIGQLEALKERVRQRRFIYAYYKLQLADISEIQFLEELPESFSNCWLTCFLIASDCVVTPTQVIEALAAENIEARHLWKPLHLQPLFRNCSYYGSNVAEDLFNRGVCLPSGSALQSTDLDRVISIIKKVFTHA